MIEKILLLAQYVFLTHTLEIKKIHTKTLKMSKNHGDLFRISVPICLRITKFHSPHISEKK